MSFDIMGMSHKKQAKTAVDIVLSVGQNCRAAEQLKIHNLRICSFPLDWMRAYDLDTALTLFKNDFEGFFKNKKIVGEEKTSKFHRLYVNDTDTGMCSMHHFIYGKDLDMQYNEDFLPIMQKRYKFAKKILQNAKHILFVSCRKMPNEKPQHFLEEMHKLYPCKMTLVNINDCIFSPHYDENRVNDYYYQKEFKINADLTIVQCYFDDRHPDKLDSWVGNSEKWGVALSPFKISFATRLKTFFLPQKH